MKSCIVGYGAVDELELKVGKASRREPPSVELTRHLLDFLLFGDFSPGQRIPSERQLAKALDVGRQAVRDALRPLAALGLLDVRVGDGTYLNPEATFLPRLIEWGLVLHDRGVLDLIETRWYLELATARLAAERRDDQAVADLRRLVAEMADARTPESFAQADTAFHVRLAEASNNSVLSGALNRIQTLLRVWIVRVLSSEPGLERSYLEHVPVLDAVVAKDADAAEAAMAAHLTSATRRLKATLEESLGANAAGEVATP
jgi:GntR family transcriptional regulator, transcriptional repressor for pyruvate dehydrogenase complex